MPDRMKHHCQYVRTVWDRGFIASHASVALSSAVLIVLMGLKFGLCPLVRLREAAQPKIDLS